MNVKVDNLVLVYYEGEYHYVYASDVHGSRNLTYYSICGIPILARKVNGCLNSPPRCGMCRDCYYEVNN